jgi:superfamily I DNA/RNA helicase
VVIEILFEEMIDTISAMRSSDKQETAFIRQLRAAERVLLNLQGTLAQRLAVIRRALENDSGAPVTLTTMHSAKGLQYDAVFSIRAADSVIPGRAQGLEEIE